MKHHITDKIGEPAFDFIQGYVEIEHEQTFVLSSTNQFNIVNYNKPLSAIINFSRINDMRFMNKFFEAANEKLKKGDFFVCCLETFTARREKSRISKVPVIGKLWSLIEFITLRVFPKMWGLKKLYFFFTRGRNRLLSKAEAFGRLASCGFELVDYASFGGLMYVVSKKVAEPDYNMKASYGPIYQMPRLGKNGKIIYVYKLRTMHPYAEYLQDYVLQVSGYAVTGKPANDFRLTPWGKVLRRYWIDELPQLLNLIKGDLKLVGVRPISERYFQEIPDDLKAMRLQSKPGCIPPYVALNRSSSVESCIQAEREYLTAASKHRFATDFKFFFMAIFNIVFRRKRSA
jgi:lipopolysaccharide/colanic/teichoic acid biosynthesis glycosyltransferase